MQTTSQITFNWPFFGNKPIIDFLQGSIASGSVAHCYVFSGSKDLGKGAVARHFVGSLLCETFGSERGTLPCGVCASCRQFGKHTHSDVYSLQCAPDKKNISIEQVREFIRELSLGTFMGAYKVGIIVDADALSLAAANALLKTLEEPRGKAVIILLTAQLSRLPVTITSRAQALQFLPAAAEAVYDNLVTNHHAGRDVARKLSRLSLGRPALAVKLWEDATFLADVESAMKALPRLVGGPSHERFRAVEDLLQGTVGTETRERALEVVSWLEVALRDMMLHRVGASDIATGIAMIPEVVVPLDAIVDLHTALARAKTYIQSNVAPKLALEMVTLQ